MNLTPYLAPLAALVLGAVVTGFVAWWYIDRARRTVLANADKRHKQDLANIAAAHVQDLAEARRSHEADYAELEANRDEMLAGWQGEYDRSRNLAERLADEQRRLDEADRDKAALRGRIADLEDTVADYARAWGEVPPAWRMPVEDLTEEAKDDVWAPPLDPSPVLVGLLADAHDNPAVPKLPTEPEEWVTEGATQWWARFDIPERKTTPVTSVRGVRGKRKDRRAVAGR